MNEMKEELWAAIPKYEGYYEASTLGRVRSVDRKIAHSGCGKSISLRGRVLKATLHKVGYLYVVLSVGGKLSTQRVHRLVAETFIPRYDLTHEVDHIDSIKTNNHVDNLRWTTHFENASRSNIGKTKNNNMEHNPRTKNVVGRNNDGVIIEQYPCAKYLTRLYGINYSTLRYHLQTGGMVINNVHYSYAI